MTSASLNATFAALADPTRRAMLERLARREMSVKDLARPFKISGPAVTKHLKVLQRAGLIKRTRQAQSRPCRLQVRPLQDVSHWVERYRQFWSASFDRLDDYLRTVQSKEPTPGAKKSGPRSS